MELTEIRQQIKDIENSSGWVRELWEMTKETFNRFAKEYYKFESKFIYDEEEIRFMIFQNLFDIINSSSENKYIKLSINKEKDTLSSILNPDKQKYPNQRMFVVEARGYAYIVPFVEDEEKYPDESGQYIQAEKQLKNI